MENPNHNKPELVRLRGPGEGAVPRVRCRPGGTGYITIPDEYFYYATDPHTSDPATGQGPCAAPRRRTRRSVQIHRWFDVAKDEATDKRNVRWRLGHCGGGLARPPAANWLGAGAGIPHEGPRSGTHTGQCVRSPPTFEEKIGKGPDHRSRPVKKRKASRSTSARRRCTAAAKMGKDLKPAAPQQPAVCSSTIGAARSRRSALGAGGDRQQGRVGLRLARPPYAPDGQAHPCAIRRREHRLRSDDPSNLTAKANARRRVNTWRQRVDGRHARRGAAARPQRPSRSCPGVPARSSRRGSCPECS